MAAKTAAESREKRTSDLWTTTVTSRSGAARRRKSRKNSRRKQRPRPTKRPTPRTTGTGNLTSSYAHLTERMNESTTPTTDSSAANVWSRVPEEGEPLNRKLTTARDQKAGIGYRTSSVLLSPIATVVPYVNIGAEKRHDYVTSGELLGSEAGTSVATVVSLAAVSVFAFWLFVTVIVLSCLLARRNKSSARPRTGCVVDSRWSWSGNQLMGLLDDTLDAPENARLFSTEHFDVSPPRWNSTSDARHRDNIRAFTAYRSLRQHTSAEERRPPRSQFLDSGYDTLAAAAAILETGDTPEMTSYDCEPMEVWTPREPVPVKSGDGCSWRRPGVDDVTTNQLTSQRRFPRMGQSCLRRDSPFTETSTPRRSDDDSSRPRLTGYIALQRSDMTTDVGTTSV